MRRCAIIPAPFSHSDQSPVAKVRADLFVELFREQSVPLIKYLTSRFRDREDAAEIAQEAWLRMFRLDDADLDNPKAFLFQTASNLAIDRARRSSLEQRFTDATFTDDQEGHPSAERTVAAEESLSVVERALAELPEKCRQAFVMHRGQDMSYVEIARALGVSTSMVEKYIIRALRHFRARLDV